MSANLPSIGTTEIPQPAEQPGPLQPTVYEADGFIYETSQAGATAYPTLDLIGKIYQIFKDNLCPSAPDPSVTPPPAPPPPSGISDEMVWAVRVMIQLLLLFLRTRTDIQMLLHPDNAAKSLVPAIDCIGGFSGAICETDPRIRKKVDFKLTAAQKGLLLQLRKVLREFKVGAFCVEAGCTHAEQHLDGTGRFVYNKLWEVLGDDIQYQQDFQPLVDLISASILAGQGTKKHGTKAAGGTPAHGTHGGTPGTGAPGPGTGGTPQGMSGAPGTGATPGTVSGPATLPVVNPPIIPVRTPRKPPRPRPAPKGHRPLKKTPR